jgi:hypothetical protein
MVDLHNLKCAVDDKGTRCRTDLLPGVLGAEALARDGLGV